ncbi:hypothetical protein ACWFRJ_30685 [Streptomyces sp. NPDC055239]
MTSVLTSLVAVVGTLLGTVLGYFFQRRNSDRGERRNAILAYANAITDVIRSQQNWWHARHEQRGGPDHIAARDEALRLCGDARRAINGLTLHLPAPALLHQAERTYDVASDVHEANGSVDLSARTDAARESLSAFIRQAAAKAP